MSEPEKEWKVNRYSSGFVSISGHYWPKFARIALLDDIEGKIYRPIGANSYDEVLYNEFDYPISHTCAVEEENKPK